MSVTKKKQQKKKQKQMFKTKYKTESRKQQKWHSGIAMYLSENIIEQENRLNARNPDKISIILFTYIFVSPFFHFFFPILFIDFIILIQSFVS